jgi:hypothetical protein
MFRRAAEVDERFAQAFAQRRGILTRGEPHEARAAVATTATWSEAPHAPLSDLLWLLILQYG